MRVGSLQVLAALGVLELALTTCSGFPVSSQDRSQGGRLPKSVLVGVGEVADTTNEVLRRSDFTRIAARAILLPYVLFPSVAGAREVDASLKGTKNDPEFEACLSRCVYECTKAKGAEQRSRLVCLPECKASCATTKEQRLIGKPLNS
jgi:hypothetical protein